MNCPDDDKLIAYVEEELPQDEHTAVHQHIEQCGRCAEELSMYDSVLTTLNDRNRPDVDPAFTQRVMNEAGFELYREQAEQHDRSWWSGSGMRGWIRRNASWLASLSLHCCLIFLLILLAVRQFRGDPRPTTGNDVFTGIPVSAAPAMDAPSDHVREHVLWRGRFRQLRAGAQGTEHTCGTEGLPKAALRKNDEALLGAQNDDGSWPAGQEEQQLSATALAVLALLRGGHRPDENGNALQRATMNGLAYLVERQHETGRIGSTDDPLHTHARATAALLESSLLSGDPGVRRSALDALDHLHNRLSDPSSDEEPGYWTFASLRIGQHLGHPRSGDLLKEVARVKDSEQGEAVTRLEALPFLPTASASDAQNKLLRRTWGDWTRNQTSYFTEERSIVVAAALHALQEDLQINWETVQKLLNKTDVTKLTSPAQRARFALIAQTCRSYPR